MASIAFADGTTFTVETADGLVQLVVRDSSGVVIHGYELAPPEAHRMGEALNAAAFTASEKKESRS